MNLWDDAKQALATVAPILGTAVGGPLGGTAARLVASALGLDPATPVPQLATAVATASPDQLLALKKADADFQLALRNLDLSADKLAVDDRASARSREAATHDWVPGTLMMLLTAGFFGLIAFLARHDVPGGNRDLLNILLGTLGSAWTGGVTYYFGSSVGSAAKDRAIGALMRR
ncbi:hypothetical protein GCM10011611_31110 [Aliidongia dinghuensis]|uniref:Holin of 3TMs, for gene-transfer release n=1 Tax=Aliidongia dinghuensis TaxID=1867774 RepID=A0A8J2YVR7_9PROT|nr:hypothetical protein [Aliidongia dinghuensis]GGF22832.1 hypothetical protein GCM10011611_31110 [Aliidongia dinghuensis]